MLSFATGLNSLMIRASMDWLPSVVGMARRVVLPRVRFRLRRFYRFGGRLSKKGYSWVARLRGS